MIPMVYIELELYRTVCLGLEERTDPHQIRYLRGIEGIVPIVTSISRSQYSRVPSISTHQILIAPSRERRRLPAFRHVTLRQEIQNDWQAH